MIDQYTDNGGYYTGGEGIIIVGNFVVTTITRSTPFDDRYYDWDRHERDERLARLVGHEFTSRRYDLQHEVAELDKYGSCCHLTSHRMVPCPTFLRVGWLGRSSHVSVIRERIRHGWSRPAHGGPRERRSHRRVLRTWER